VVEDGREDASPVWTLAKLETCRGAAVGHIAETGEKTAGDVVERTVGRRTVARIAQFEQWSLYPRDAEHEVEVLVDGDAQHALEERRQPSRVFPRHPDGIVARRQRQPLDG
ncbi:MAG: hypothetical protein ACK559_13085, partial [bacterium]